MIHYPTISDCLWGIFPFVQREMTAAEPAPPYHQEEGGMTKLSTTLELMRRSEYPHILSKAAYLFCSIVDGHHFSNGNKRLGVALLTFFLLQNGRSFRPMNVSDVKKLLQQYFPRMHWENVQSFQRPHEFFLYHIALIVADRRQKGDLSFFEEQRRVRLCLQKVTV